MILISVLFPFTISVNLYDRKSSLSSMSFNNPVSSNELTDLFRTGLETSRRRLISL